MQGQASQGPDSLGLPPLRAVREADPAAPSSDPAERAQQALRNEDLAFFGLELSSAAEDPRVRDYEQAVSGEEDVQESALRLAAEEHRVLDRQINLDEWQGAPAADERKVDRSKMLYALLTDRQPEILKEAGTSAEAQELWKMWIKSLVYGANALSVEADAEFMANQDHVDDVRYGPSDFGRTHSGGFVRQSVTSLDGHVDRTQIVWMVTTPGGEAIWQRLAFAVKEICAEWIEELALDRAPSRRCARLSRWRLPPARADARLRADPTAGVPQSSAEARLNRAGRGGPTRAVRNQYGLPVIDRFTGMPLEERVPRDLVIRNFRRVKEAATSKKARSATGCATPTARSCRSCGGVRCCTRRTRCGSSSPIRLNEHHWEWQGGRRRGRERASERRRRRRSRRAGA